MADRTNELAPAPTPPEPPAAARLIASALVFLHDRGLRAFGLALLVCVGLFILLDASMALLVALPLLLGKYIFWSHGTAWFLFLLGMAPFVAGYAYVVWLWLENQEAGFKDLWAPFKKWQLLLNVTVAGAAPMVGFFLLQTLWRLLGENAPPLIDPESPLMHFWEQIPGNVWLAAQLQDALHAIIVLPLAWAGLDVLVGGRSCLQALCRSAQLAFKRHGLALAMFVVMAVVPNIYYVAAPLTWKYPSLSGWGPMPLHALFAPVSVLLSAIQTTLESLVLVILYREMTRREEAYAEQACAPSLPPAPAA
jgi:hypothetical protein